VLDSSDKAVSSEKDAHQENSTGLSDCRELESFIIDWGERLLQDSSEEANSSKEKADKEAARLSHQS